MRAWSSRPLTLLSAALLLAVAAGACKKAAPEPTLATTSASVSSSAPPPPPPRAPSPRRTGSALARTVTSDALYVADEDHDTLRRVGLPLDQLDIQATRLPGPPAQVIVRDGEVWVTVRDPGLLLGFAIEKRELREVARVALPADAWGMALSPDEATMVVTSAWTHAVSVVDLATRTVTRTLDVAREPRGVVFAPDGSHAYVTHLVGTSLTRVDLGGDGPRAAPVALPASPLRAPPGGVTPGASLAYAATLSADGKRLLVPRHALGTWMPIQPADPSGGWDGSSTPPSAIWFGSATVDVLTLAKDQPLVPRRSSVATIVNTGEGGAVVAPDHGATTPSSDPTPFVQPRDVMVRRRTGSVLVVSEGTNLIAEHDARALDPSLGRLRAYAVGSRQNREGAQVAMAGAAPQGLALSEDEDTAWVMARGTYEVAEVPLSIADRSRDEIEARRDRPKDPRYVHLADDPLGPDGSLGRRIFYDATDSTVSGGLACAGCHPEGRDDGFVWHQTREVRDKPDTRNPDVFVGHPLALQTAEDDGFARQTPMLAGRIDAEGPYGWHGQNKDLETRVAEGFRLHRWAGNGSPTSKDETLRIRQLLAFLQRKGLRPPPRDTRPLTEEEERGKAIFLSEKAQCASCHPAGEGYTTRASVPLRTPLPARPGFAEEPDDAFKVPSLLFVGGTAPYYHDGSAPTLEALIEKNGDRMGQTGHLDAAEKKALVAFLRTL